jgi:glutathione S-transferase
MVRQVFSKRVFRPAAGEPADELEVSAGIETSRRVLGALNAIAAEGRVLDGQNFTIADCHLAPMVAYFVQAPEGARALSGHAALAGWWAAASQRTSLRATCPGLPSP